MPVHAFVPLMRASRHDYPPGLRPSRGRLPHKSCLGKAIDQRSIPVTALSAFMRVEQGFRRSSSGQRSARTWNCNGLDAPAKWGFVSESDHDSLQMCGRCQIHHLARKVHPNTW